MALLGDKKILYVSGEEAETQIKIRADRLGIKNKNCHIYSETSTQKIQLTHLQALLLKQYPILCPVL